MHPLKACCCEIGSRKRRRSEFGLPAEAHAGQICTGQIGIAQICSIQIHSQEISAREVHTCQVAVAEVLIPKDRVGKIGLSENSRCPDQRLIAPQIYIGQVCSVKIRSGKLGIHKVCSGQCCAAEIRSRQHRARHINAGERSIHKSPVSQIAIVTHAVAS